MSASEKSTTNLTLNWSLSREKEPLVTLWALAVVNMVARSNRQNAFFMMRCVRQYNYNNQRKDIYLIYEILIVSRRKKELREGSSLVAE